MGLLFNCTLEVIDGVFKVNIDGEVVVNFEDQAVELDHLDQEASVFAARCYASVRHKPMIAMGVLTELNLLTASCIPQR